MVSFRHVLGIAFVSSLLSPAAVGDSAIRSVSVASERLIHIKPCQPVFVILDVTVAGSRGETFVRGVIHDLRRTAIVTNSDSGVRLHDPDAYPVAVVFLNEGSIGTDQNDNTSFQAIALLYWNVEVEEYLFVRAGVYEVEFGSETRLQVTVEQPTVEEEKVIRKLVDAGEAWAPFLIGPIDGRPSGAAPIVEDMLERLPNTAYTPYLSMSLGLSKIRGAQHDPEIAPSTMLDKQAALATKYLEPYCNGAIKSPLEAAAAVRLAEIRLAQSRGQREGDSEPAATFRREAKALLERVKNSPYSVDMRSKAVHKLRALGKVDASVEGD